LVKVKICGITNPEDALKAADYGADAMGFVFFEGSPRCISPDEARDIIMKLPPCVTTVGVFVNERMEETERIASHALIDIIQLHGHESPEMCLVNRRVIRAVRVRELDDLEHLKQCVASAYLLDTYDPELYGGTGQIFNWDIAVEAKKVGRIILAGGLSPENVEEAVRRVRPYAVDVSSGVEDEKRRKNHLKMRLFIERAKGA
jgi:phosphoribosylanthranilate isomerase